MRTTAQIAALIGAPASLTLMFYAGRRQQSIILLALFTSWVVSPFVAYAIASVLSKSWTPLTRTTLHTAMLLVTLASLGIYATAAFGPPIAKTGFIFLMVPLGSWLFAAIAVSLAVFLSRDRA